MPLKRAVFLQTGNTLSWVKRLKMASELDGVHLSEVDCAELSWYIEQLELSVNQAREASLPGGTP